MMQGGSDGDHRIDDAPPVPARSGTEIVREAVLVLPHLIALIGRLLADPRVPRRRKLVVAGVVGYLLLPIDLIPDFLPVIGQVDDLVLAAVAVHVLLHGAPETVRARYWAGSEDALDLVTAVIDWGAEMIPARFRRLLAG